MLTQIMYLSRSKHPMGHESDASILDEARARNAELDLTGFLFRTDHSFLQILEGDEKAVDAVMEMIRRDPRHELTAEWPKYSVDSRRFANWRMGSGPLARDMITKLQSPKDSDEVVWAAMIDQLSALAQAEA